MKKAILIFLFLILSINPAVAAAADVEFDFRSAAQLLMDVNSRQIIYENNIHEKLYPASVTKIMTMLLAMEALDAGKAALDDMIPISEEAAAHGGSQIFHSPGDRVSFEDLIIGIGVGSAYDVSWAIAEYESG